MIQPAGYIRIMAEELVKNNRSVFGKVVTGVEHAAVGLPFVHLLQPPPGNPDERIEPKETADQLDGDAFRRMAVTDMTRFMAENDHAPAPFVSLAQKNRAQERKGSGDLRMLGKGVRPAIGQTRPSPQTANSDHADRKKPKRQKHRRQIASHSHRAQYAPPAGWRRILRPVAVGGYLTAVFLSLGFLAVRMVGIRRLRRRSRLTDCGAYTLAEHPQIATPFSFLRTVFLGEGYEGRRRMIVLCHEAGHVRHRHSAERIAVELVRSLFWFNPFVWIAGRWLQEVHEWEADRGVLDAGYDLTEYRTVIFHQLFGHNPDIACGLNHSLTKKRFAMMTQFRKRRFAVLRLGAAIPVVAAMMMLCSFTVKTPLPAAGDPDRPTVTVHISSGGKILFNGRPVTVGDLERLIAAEREKLSEADRAQMEVVLRADKDAPMADLADVMDASRRAHAFRLKLTAEASDPGIVRMLPPDPLRLPADSADYALPATNRNDR